MQASLIYLVKLDFKPYPGPDSIRNILSPAFRVLSCVRNDYRKVRIFVQDLFYATIVSALLWLNVPAAWIGSPKNLVSIVFVVDVAKVTRSRYELRRV